jgi:hypothetical protein
MKLSVNAVTAAASRASNYTDNHQEQAKDGEQNPGAISQC